MHRLGLALVLDLDLLQAQPRAGGEEVGVAVDANGEQEVQREEVGHHVDGEAHEPPVVGGGLGGVAEKQDLCGCVCVMCVNKGARVNGFSSNP